MIDRNGGCVDDVAWRARDEVVNAVALRPVADEEQRRAVPAVVVRRDLGLTVAAGVADLLTAAGVVAVGAEAWTTTAVGVVVGSAGVTAVFEAFQEARRRRLDAARLRQHGPDDVDALTALGADAPPRWVLVVNAVWDLALLAALVVVLVQAWDQGPTARVVVVAAVVGRVAAAWLGGRYLRRKRTWCAEFLRAEGIEPPPLPDRWQVLVRRCSAVTRPPAGPSPRHVPRRWR